MNGQKQNQSEVEQSMAEPNGNETGRSLSHKEEKQMAAEPLRAEENSPRPQIDAKKLKRRRRRRCCFCCAASLIIIVVIIIILAFTVFKAKDPEITVNSISITGLKSSLDANTLRVHLNLTVLVGLAVKNPTKIASFKHGNSTTIILYSDKDVGEAILPPGTIKADKTVNMNITVTVYVDEFMSSGSSLVGDGISGNLPLTTRTKIAGRVKLLGMVKKHISVSVQCNINVHLSNLTTEIQQCDKKYKL